MNIKPVWLSRYVPFVVMFIMMCGLKLWFTMLLFILFAFVLTISKGKRSFCSSFCPLGGLQDAFASKKVRKTLLRPSWWMILRYSVFFLFWGYIIISVVLSIHEPAKIWANLLRLMLLIFTSAIVLQEIFKKRFWCSELCPVGMSLERTVRLRNMLFHENKNDIR